MTATGIIGDAILIAAVLTIILLEHRRHRRRAAQRPVDGPGGPIDAADVPVRARWVRYRHPSPEAEAAADVLARLIRLADGADERRIAALHRVHNHEKETA